MPNVGDELHHFGWNRCSSACHGPDRSHLIVPGFRSSRIHIVNVADDPRAPRIEKVIEADEVVREDRLHAGRTRRTACPAATWSSACSATPTGTAPADSPCSTRRRSRSRAAGRTVARHRRSTTTSGISRARTCSSRPSSASRTPTSRGSTSRTSRRGATGTVSTSGIWPSGSSSRLSTSAKAGCFRSRCAGSTIPRRRRASSALRSRARCGASGATTAAGPPTR